MTDERIKRARQLLSQVTAGFHGGTDLVVVNNWAVEAYTLLCEVIDEKES